MASKVTPSSPGAPSFCLASAYASPPHRFKILIFLAGPRSATAALVQLCLCDVNVAIDFPGLPQIPAPATDQSCAATSSANTPIGVGCPHAAPWCANLHTARRSRRNRLQFPAGSFIEGFRTPATVQAASLRSAGIPNPQQYRKTASLDYLVGAGQQHR